MAWDPLRPWPRGRVWVWTALGTLALFAQGPSFVQGLRPAASQGVDFFQEWASARNVLGGTPAYESQDAAMRRYLGLARDRRDPQFIAHNAHPPSSIFLALPLAGLAYPDATLAWNLLSILFVVASLAIVARELEIRIPAWSIFPAIVLALTCNPLRQTFNQGQLNGALLILLTLAWRADRRGRQGASGALVALAAAIKLFPAFLLGYFALRRRWRALGSSVLTLGALTVATGETIGWQAYRDYCQVVLPEVATFRSDWPNASLPGFWDKLLGAGAIHFGHKVEPLAALPHLALAATLLSLGPLLMCWKRNVARASTPSQSDRAFALSLIAMLLASPICWDHYLLLLLLPLTLTWMGLSAGHGSHLLLAIVCLGIWVNPIQIWAIGLPDPGSLQTWSISAPVALATLLVYPTYLLVVLYAMLVRVGRPDPATCLAKTRGFPDSQVVPQRVDRFIGSPERSCRVASSLAPLRDGSAT
jgi:hypothetical protein